MVGTAALSARVRRHIDATLDSGLDPTLRELATAVDAVGAGAHPASACLEAVISRYGRARPTDPPAVYLAAEAHEVEVVVSWLGDEELDAAVEAVTRLRDADVRDALVLLGPPARYLTSPWCPPTQAARRGGWLLTAPPARHVHVVTWPGHPRLDLEVTNAFPNTSPPRPWTERRGAIVDGDDQPVWLPPKPVDPRVNIRSEWVQDRDPVEAVAVLLADRSFALYPRRDEPLPEVVTWDGGSVEVLDTPVTGLAAGAVLLFRPHRSASDEELRRRANQSLSAKYGPDAPADAEAARRELKNAFAARTLTIEQFIYELTSKLNDDRYARHIATSLPGDNYIAPQKRGAYQAVRRVLRLGEDVTAEGLLRALRAARRHAGIEITRDLIEVLRSTDGWQATLEADGAATVGAGELFGTLNLRVIAAIDPTPRRVGRSHLGRLLEQ